MTDSIDFKYRAFLSYSHADTPLAKWLHSHLESFSLRGLAGSEIAPGPVPKSLKPIFLDRDDFSAGLILNDQTIAALNASAALIVLCSPASARSRYVSENIRLFKHRRPERRIVPVIVPGKPDDAAQECFPPALKFELDAEGQITDRLAAATIAAAVREDGKGDGRELMLAKIVASLIGLPPGEVLKRAERERKRQARIRDAIAVSVVLLAVAGGYFAHRLQKQSQGAGHPQVEAAHDDRAAGLGKVEGERLAKAEPSNAGSQRDLSISFEKSGDALTAKGALAEALKAYRDGLAITDRLAKADSANTELQRDLSVSYNKVGDVLLAQGVIDEALEAYRAGLAIRAPLAKADAENPGLQHDLSVSYDKVGDILMAKGAAADALTVYRDGLDIADRLTKAEPANTQWQRDLSVFYNKVGDVLVDQGAIDDALKAYRDSLTIRERLAEADPANAGWLADLAVSHGKLGQLLVRMGDRAEARRMFERGRTIVAPFAEKSGHQLWIGYLKAFDESLAALDKTPG